MKTFPSSTLTHANPYIHAHTHTRTITLTRILLARYTSVFIHFQRAIHHDCVPTVAITHHPGAPCSVILCSMLNHSPPHHPLLCAQAGRSTTSRIHPRPAVLSSPCPRRTPSKPSQCRCGTNSWGASAHRSSSQSALGAPHAPLSNQASLDSMQKNMQI